MPFSSNSKWLKHDLDEVIRAFPINITNIEITHDFIESILFIKNNITINEKTYSYSSPNTVKNEENEVVRKRIIKRVAKLAMYEAMSNYFNVNLPWGSLMGVRPIKLYKSLIDNEAIDAYRYFQDYYKVSKQKTNLVQNIYNYQLDYFSKNEKDLILYVGIPFCVSRCYYCSFISADLRNTSDILVDKYVDALCLDIVNAKQLIRDKGYNLKSVYMGGGTPTALNAMQLEKILLYMDFDNIEYTVEAGRADTIDDEKLKLISQRANRISINPQTLNDTTLQKIGRNHTSKDFFNTFELARKYDFEINCDLISGLVDETVNDVENSVKGVINLNPEDITMHTLSLKAGSKLKETTKENINNEIGKMLDITYKLVDEAGYRPYYLYRQKYMAGGFENVGFTKNTPCTYNIDIMQENTINLACGSYGISKRYYRNPEHITRFAMPKDVKTYIDKLSINLEKRDKLFN